MASSWLQTIQDYRLKKLGTSEVPKPDLKTHPEYAESFTACPVCGIGLGNHPFDFSVMCDDSPVFVLACNGKRYKL